MPALDYAFICDHVRVEGGVAHALAVGIDAIYASEVPAGQNLGLLMRITFTQGECGRPHRIEVFFRDTDGADLAKIEGEALPQWQDDLPVGWPVGSLIGLNFGVPLPSYGTYAFEILINDSHAKSLDLRVAEPPHVDVRE